MPGDRQTSGDTSSRDLYVVFEVAPGPGSSCPLGGFSDEIVEIRQQLVNDECHTDTTINTEQCDCEPNQKCREVVHVTSDVDSCCPCTVFGEFDCVPKLVDIDDGRIQIETHVPDRDRLDDLVKALKEVSTGLRLCQLKRIDPKSVEQDGNSVTLDLYEVTEKQREAVTKAVSAGYYTTPRETTLAELADDFEISKSALSQRLNAVESKLATSAFTQMSAHD